MSEEKDFIKRTYKEQIEKPQEWILTGNVFEDMAQFDLKYGFDSVPMTPKFLAFRMRFLVEELFEAILACETNDPDKLVDSLIDLIVVAAGTLSIGKVDGQKAWDEVRRANMSKERRENLTRQGSGGADLVKPDGWQAPDHTHNWGTLPECLGSEFNQHFSHSATVLFEAMTMQFRKNADYNSEASGIRRADYFPRGLDDLFYEINKKHLRFKSLIEKMKRGGTAENESMEDTSQDTINYHTFVVALLRYRLEGQNPMKNFFGELEV